MVRALSCGGSKYSTVNPVFHVSRAKLWWLYLPATLFHQTIKFLVPFYVFFKWLRFQQNMSKYWATYGSWPAACTHKKNIPLNKMPIRCSLNSLLILKKILTNSTALKKMDRLISVSSRWEFIVEKNCNFLFSNDLGNIYREWNNSELYKKILKKY